MRRDFSHGRSKWKDWIETTTTNGNGPNELDLKKKPSKSLIKQDCGNDVHALNGMFPN